MRALDAISFTAIGQVCRTCRLSRTSWRNCSGRARSGCFSRLACDSVTMGSASSILARAEAPSKAAFSR